MRNLKKVLSLALAMVMLLGMMVIGAGAVDATEYPDYGDVSADKQEAVQVITKLSVIDGTEKGMEPQSTLTRAQAATIVARALLGRTVADALASSTCVFTDVPDWAKGAVQYCADRGIVFGIGNNLFGSNNPVKGTEFATMLLRAVDPEGDYSGSGWENKAIVAANKFGLSDKVAVTSTALTREGAAQMAFNTITSYSPSGATAWSVDGKTFDSFIEAYLYADKLGKVGEIEKTAANDSLAATVFNLSSSNKTDAFGRNTKVWTVDKDDIVTVPGTGATLTFTKGITANDLNGYTVDPKAKLIEDGVTATAVPNIAGIRAQSGNGIEVNIYATDKSITKVVVINEYFGNVSTVTAAKGDDKRTVTVNGKKFETEDFEKGDKVIYTLATVDGKEAIQSMELATLVENTQVTRKTGTTKFTADGTEYEYATIASNKDKVVVNNWVDLYLDSFGYMVSAEENEGEQFYAAVIGVGSNNPYGDASGGCTLLLADGTTVSANYRLKSGDLGSQKVHNSSNVASDGWPADIVKYRVLDDGTYELRVVGAQDQTYDDVDNEIQFTNGKSEFILDDGADGTGETTLYTTSNTVFMVATKDGDSGRIAYRVYTGYNAAPSIASGETNHSVAVAKTGNRIDVVYLAYDEMSGMTSVNTFVAVAADKTEISDSTGDYYELPAVVDGEVTTVKVDADKADADLVTGVNALSGVITDSDDIITNFTATTVFTPSGTGVVAADGEVLGIGADASTAAYWAYNDNTLAYYVNKNYTSITALDVEDIVTDNNDLVRATLSSDGKTLKDVFVVEQDAPTVSNYTLSWTAPTTNVSDLTVKNGGTALTSGATLHGGETITVSANVATNYRLDITAGGTETSITGNNSTTFVMPEANTEIKFAVADTNLVPQNKLSYVLSTDTSVGSKGDPFIVGVYHNGALPKNSQMLNDVAKLLGITDVSDVVEADDGTKVTFTVVNGMSKTYYELTYGSAVDCWVGKVNGETVFVKKGEAISALDAYAKINKPLTAAPSGHAFDESEHKTGLTGTVDADNANYYPVSTTITANGFDLTTGFVKITTVPAVTGTGATNLTVKTTLNNTTTEVTANGMVKATDTFKIVLTASDTIAATASATTGFKVTCATSTIAFSDTTKVKTGETGAASLELKTDAAVAKNDYFTVTITAADSISVAAAIGVQ